MSQPRSDVVTRALSLYRRTATSRSAAALVAANLVPLAGVLLFGWSLWTILVLYWLENGIVGLWTVPRILLARAVPAGMGWARPELALFFLVHYGIFWLGHGLFVFILPAFLGFAGAASPDGLIDGFPSFDPTTGLPVPGAPAAAATAFGEIAWSSVALGSLAMLVSHGISFFVNYLGRGEYLRAAPSAQAFAPYGRVVILHVTILVGGFAVAFLGAPLLLLVALVTLKTLFDLVLHLRQHGASG